MAAFTMLSVSTIGSQTLADPSTEQVLEWYKTQLDEASKPYTFDGFSLRWDTHLYTMMSDDELAQMRRDVEGKPDHPGRMQLQLHDQAKSRGYILNQHQLFANGKDQWRYNFSQVDLYYTDSVLSRNASWRTTPTEIRLYSPADSLSGADPRLTVRHDENVFTVDVDRIFFGLAGAMRRVGAEVVTADVQGDNWTVTASSPTVVNGRSVVSYEIAGEWNSEARRGFVRSVRNLTYPSAEWEGDTETFDAWVIDPKHDIWYCPKVIISKQNGRKYRSVENISLSGLPEGGFPAVIVPPTHGGSDAVRGKYTQTVVTDYPRGKRTEYNKDGSAHSSALELIELSDSRWSWLRPFGWVLFVLIIGAGVLYRQGYLRRSKA